MGKDSHSMADEIPAPSNEELRAIRQKQLEDMEAAQAAMQAAAEELPKLMAKDGDLSRYAYMMLFGYRLIHWAAAETEHIKGMTPAMHHILLEAQEMKAREIFSVAEMIKDFQDKQMPWLEGQRRESLAKRTSRERKISKLVQRLRRKDIPLPFHSMTALFGEAGFQHNNILLVYGPSAALALVLRRCALDYQKTGGTAALLSGMNGDEGDSRIAGITLPPSRWRDMGYVYSDVLSVLEPVTALKAGKAAGLLVVEGLDNACLHSQVQEGRPYRLLRTLSYLQNFHRTNGMAVIVGVETDDDPAGMDMGQLYLPQMLLSPHVIVRLQESQIADGAMNVVVGNDVVPMSLLREQVEGETRE